MIYCMKRYLTEINPRPGSKSLKPEGRVHCALISRFDTAFWNEIKWSDWFSIDSRKSLNIFFFHLEHTVYVWVVCWERCQRCLRERTHLYKPSCRGQVRNRRSSRRCILLARGHSGRFRTRSGFRIPLLGDPRSRCSALLGHRNAGKTWLF